MEERDNFDDMWRNKWCCLEVRVGDFKYGRLVFLVMVKMGFLNFRVCNKASRILIMEHVCGTHNAFYNRFFKNVGDIMDNTIWNSLGMFGIVF